MEQKMCRECDGHQTPESVHPGPVVGSFDEDVGNNCEDEVKDDVGLNDSSLAVTCPYSNLLHVYNSIKGYQDTRRNLQEAFARAQQRFTVYAANKPGNAIVKRRLGRASF